ncbi:MAG: AMP-binding protein [Clostridia bacterium]|nr:AMP-binding protein [Clostridia bacterium]
MKNTIKACVKPKFISDLRDLVCGNARLYGDKTLYYYKEPGSKEVREFSYNTAMERMNWLGTAFAKLGIMGNHIAVIGDTHPDYMTTYYAAVNGGGVIVPLDKELSTEQLVNFCNLAEISAIAYTSSFNNKLTDLIDELPDVRYFIPISKGEESDNDKVRQFEDLIELGKTELENGNRDFVDYEIHASDLAAILFTSGTTGTSKGVMLTQGNLTAATNSSCQSMEYDYNNTFVSVLPMHHSYEITCGHFAISNLGASIFINDSLKNALRSFSYFKPNALMLVPLFVETMYKKIWHEIDKKGMHKKVRAAMKLSDGLLAVGIDKRDKFFGQITGALGGNLKSIVCGGAPIDPKLIKDFRSFGISIFEGYGITECAPLVAVNSPGKERYRSVGLPVYGCSVKIDKKPNEETGEILVKGDNVMIGYYKNEQATKEAFTDDGWFKTGDIGYIDKDGYIFITGRKKNVIILSNGKNVFPEEVEGYLSTCELISEAVVIGRKNAIGDIVITAVVYPDYERFEGKSDDEILAQIKERINNINRNLPSFKQIRDVELKKEEFEKTTSRKIKRFLVK